MLDTEKRLHTEKVLSLASIGTTYVSFIMRERGLDIPKILDLLDNRDYHNISAQLMEAVLDFRTGTGFSLNENGIVSARAMLTIDTATRKLQQLSATEGKPEIVVPTEEWSVTLTEENLVQLMNSVGRVDAKWAAKFHKEYLTKRLDEDALVTTTLGPVETPTHYTENEGHFRRCCALHGCHFGSTNCPVAQRKLRQKELCGLCKREYLDGFSGLAHALIAADYYKVAHNRKGYGHRSLIYTGRLI